MRRGWHRPARPVAEAVWELLAPAFDITTDKLFPASPPRECWDDDATRLTVKQAFMVAIDAAVRAGKMERCSRSILSSTLWPLAGATATVKSERKGELKSHGT